MNKMQERIATVRKAVNFEKTDRIPTHSNYWTYMMLDAGYTLKEAIYDYDKLIDAIIGFHKKYNFCMDLSSETPCIFQNNFKLCTLPPRIYP